MLQNIVRDKLISVLDIGSSKICCLIARITPKSGLQIVSKGLSRSQGFTKGKITDLGLLSNSIRSAVDIAEKQFGETISGVIVNISSPSLKSQLIGAQVKLAGTPIGNTDVNKALNQAISHFTIEEEQILHRIALNYSIDGDDDKVDPRGMVGSMLGVELNMISCGTTPIRNTTNIISNCYLQTQGLVASPIASAQACLTDDEKQLGCLMIDIGAGCCSFAVMAKNKIEYIGIIPVASGHITSDIAQGLSVSLEDAEQLKNLYGRTFCTPQDKKETLTINLIGENEDEGSVSIPKSSLIDIIQPRVFEIFELIKQRLIEDNFYHIPSRRVVLTGGGSQLQGIKEACAFIFENRQVRIGYPVLDNLSEDLENPIFSTPIGLIKYAFDTALTEKEQETGLLHKTEKFGRIGKWFLQSF